MHRVEVTTMGCTCKKTKCLKLYCQCFAVKIYCGGNCQCLICRDSGENEKERKDAIHNILSRNPSAFDTKFKKNKALDTQVIPDRLLGCKLGCKCRKSACMKKYCECYAGNVKCSSNCRCVGCKNMLRGGLDPGGAPKAGAAVLARDSPHTSSDEEDPATGKKREPWMMNAAHNLVRTAKQTRNVLAILLTSQDLILFVSFAGFSETCITSCCRKAKTDIVGRHHRSGFYAVAGF